jgi:hypothetical protein
MDIALTLFGIVMLCFGCCLFGWMLHIEFCQWRETKNKAHRENFERAVTEVNQKYGPALKKLAN